MHNVIFLRVLREFGPAQVTWRVDVKFPTCDLPAPQILANQENGPVAYNENDVYSKALGPLRRLEDGENGDWVETEECPTDCHHSLRCVSG